MLIRKPTERGCRLRHSKAHTIAGITVTVWLVAICGCTSIQPIEPGGPVYPPGHHLRYDMVPEHSHVVGIPVTGLRGNPARLIISIRDGYNPAVVFDSEVHHTHRDGYLLYQLDRALLSARCADAGITNAPSQIEVKIQDKRDPEEGFVSRWFRWWGRSDSENYFILGR